MKNLLLLSTIVVLYTACKPSGDWPPTLPLHPSYTGEATFDWWSGEQKWPVRAEFFPRGQDSLLSIIITRLGEDNQFILQDYSLNHVPLWRIEDTLVVKRYQYEETDYVSSSMFFADNDVMLDSYDIDTTEYNWLVLEHWNSDVELAEISFDLHYIRRDSVGSQPAATKRVHFADGWLSVTVYRD